MSLTGGQALVQALAREGVTAVFGLPGVQLDWAFDALHEARDTIMTYHTRHEQATAYMADGYARTTGRVGVCMMVPGPGLLNASAGLATAYACSSPVLCLTGQIDSRGIDQSLGMLHEVPRQLELLRSVTKWAGRALAPAEIPGLVGAAFQHLRAGRPRPVGIEVPPDILQARAEVAPHAPIPVAPAAPDPDQLHQAAALLHAAERPVIVSGGGTLAAGAWVELAGLAEALEAPVVMTLNGRGSLSDRHDLALNGFAGQAVCEGADLILAVGTRFWQPARVWRLTPGVPIIRIDADADELARHGPPTVGLVGDARLALAALRDRLDGRAARPSRRAELATIKRAAAERLAAIQPQAAYTAAIRAELPDDGIVVNDLTQITFYGTIGFPVYGPRTFVGAGYQGTLGAAFATALGAQVGHPDRPVVALVGDGGFLYNLAELATARQHGLPVVTIVFNDNAFGNVKRMQQQAFGGRLIAADLVNPDFAALAETFGVSGIRVADPDGLQQALRSALAARQPAVIEVTVGEMPSVWPLIVPAGGSYPVMLG